MSGEESDARPPSAPFVIGAGTVHLGEGSGWVSYGQVREHAFEVTAEEPHGKAETLQAYLRELHRQGRAELTVTALAPGEPLHGLLPYEAADRTHRALHFTWRPTRPAVAPVRRRRDESRASVAARRRVATAMRRRRRRAGLPMMVECDPRDVFMPNVEVRTHTVPGGAFIEITGQAQS